MNSAEILLTLEFIRPIYVISIDCNIIRNAEKNLICNNAPCIHWHLSAFFIWNLIVTQSSRSKAYSLCWWSRWPILKPRGNQLVSITIETTSSLDTAAAFKNKFYINYLIKQQQKQLIRDIHNQEIV